MRPFTCAVCGSLLVAENSVCVSCGTAVGFAPSVMSLVPIDGDTGRATDEGLDAVRCTAFGPIGCNWLVDDGHASGLCLSCRLTRTRPADTDAEALTAWASTERAKRRLVYQLVHLQLPVVPRRDDPRGLAFDLLSSAQRSVVTGHAGGVVTIDLAEEHDAHREAIRLRMGEPYRTMLGHLRHEVGHYYWQVLVAGSGLVPGAGADALERCRALFGDERADYAAALQRHYDQGAPPDWRSRHVSEYATAHPWEDWAETFAHYLHIRDTLQTAAAYGLEVTGPDAGGGRAVPLSAHPSDGAPGPGQIRSLIATWLPLTYALNAVNRSMGKADLYPFVLTGAVIAKLGFVHDLITS